MTWICGSRVDYEIALDNCREWYQHTPEADDHFPIGCLVEHAKDNNLPQDVIDELITLGEALNTVFLNGPEIIKAFVTAIGMTEDMDQLLAAHQAGDEAKIREILWATKGNE